MENNKIKSITLDSFRAFSGVTELNFEINDDIADIVVIYAPNGTGKTSTIEGIEWATTGKVSRLEKIFTSNPKGNKNPKEGNILKNRQSKNKIGSVTINFEDDKSIVRKTKPKLNRNNDYCEGNSEGSIKTIEHFDKNILSQGTINRFSYEASSGILFNSLINSGENNKDVILYDKLNEKKTKITKSNENKKIEISLIKKLLKSEKKELSKIDCELIDNSNFKESDNYDLFKNNFKVYDNFEYITNNEEIIYTIKNIIDTFDSLKDKLISFNILSFKDSVKKVIVLTKLITIKNSIIEKNNVLDIYNTTINTLEKEKKRYQEHLDKENIKTKKSIISSYYNNRDNIKQSDKYISKLIKTKTSILNKTDSIGLQHLNNKEVKLERTISLLNEVVNNDYNIIYSLYNYNEIMDSINNVIDRKKTLLELINRENYIKNISNDIVKNLIEKEKLLEKTNQSINDLIKQKKETISLEEKIKLIKTYANEIINERQLANCPTCGHQYDNVDILLESVNSLKNSSTTLIESAISNLINDKDNLILQIKEINNIIDRSISSDRQSTSQEIETLTSKKNKISELNLLLTELELELESKSARFNDILSNIESQKDETKRVINIINNRTIKYKKWCDNIEINIEIEHSKSKTHREEINLINVLCLTKFNLDINQIIYDAKSHHVFLYYKKNTDEALQILNNSVSEITDEIKILNEKKIYLHDKISFDLNANIQEEIKKATITKTEIRTSFNYIKNHINNYTISSNSFYINLIINLRESFSTYNSYIENSKTLNDKKLSILSYEKQIDTKNKELNDGIKMSQMLKDALDDSLIYFSELASTNINSKVLNDMFMYIEPHLTYDEISFKVDLDGKSKGIYIQTKSNKFKDNNTPIYYLSEAQINILSICIFLAKHAKNIDSEFNTIIIDDPVQSMDDLNSYALIDLCKIFSRRFNKQIIITTHNRSFYNLFRDKLPSATYSTKYISL